jgi:hypothetical protein
MVGPQLRFSIYSIPVAVGVSDFLILTVFAWLSLDAEPGPRTTDISMLVASVAVAVLVLLIAFAIEYAIISSDSPGDLLGPMQLSFFGAATLSRGESVYSRRPVAGIWLRYAVNLAIAASGVVVAAVALTRDGITWRSALITSVLVTSMVLLRLCPIQGLDGGKLCRRYFSLIFDDEDTEEQLMRLLSMAISVMYMFSGFFMVMQESRWNHWGLPVIAAGMDTALLTQWQVRRERWARAASRKTIEEIGHSRLPSIKHSAPISELLSIFAVEGQRALVVVTDDRGQPTGLIQLRQLRAAVHAGSEVHPNEMMVTLSDIPRIDRETSILDAALYLEKTGQLAMVFEASAGKLRVVSLDELRGFID